MRGEKRTYDDLDRVVASTDVERKPTAANFVTRLAYDLAGRLVTSSSLDGVNSHSCNDRSTLLRTDSPPGPGRGFGSRHTFRLRRSVAKTPEVLRIGDFKVSAVPKGAVGVPTQTGKGLEYAIPRGTPELSERAASVRIMNPVTTGQYQYPNGYAVRARRSIRWPGRPSRTPIPSLTSR